MIQIRLLCVVMPGCSEMNSACKDTDKHNKRRNNCYKNRSRFCFFEKFYSRVRKLLTSCNIYFMLQLLHFNTENHLKKCNNMLVKRHDNALAKAISSQGWLLRKTGLPFNFK